MPQTGHTYLAYGPLLCGAQTVIFEGIPVHPTPARCWQIVEKYKVAPTLHTACLRACRHHSACSVVCRALMLNAVFWVEGHQKVEAAADA